MAMNNGMRRYYAQERMSCGDRVQSGEKNCCGEKVQSSEKMSCSDRVHSDEKMLCGDRSQMQVQRYRDNAIMPVNCNDRKSVMACVYETGFALIETMLYLDTHPNDLEALSYFAQMKQQYKMCVKKYNEICGPLQFTDVNDDNYWTWVMTPMPWEMEG